MTRLVLNLHTAYSDVGGTLINAHNGSLRAPPAYRFFDFLSSSE
jgi:hypothetical protein